MVPILDKNFLDPFGTNLAVNVKILTVGPIIPFWLNFDSIFNYFVFGV